MCPTLLIILCSSSHVRVRKCWSLRLLIFLDFLHSWLPSFLSLPNMCETKLCDWLNLHTLDQCGDASMRESVCAFVTSNLALNDPKGVNRPHLPMALGGLTFITFFTRGLLSSETAISGFRSRLQDSKYDFSRDKQVSCDVFRDLIVAMLKQCLLPGFSCYRDPSTSTPLHRWVLASVNSRDTQCAAVGSLAKVWQRKSWTPSFLHSRCIWMSWTSPCSPSWGGRSESKSTTSSGGWTRHEWVVSCDEQKLQWRPMVLLRTKWLRTYAKSPIGCQSIHADIMSWNGSGGGSFSVFATLYRDRIHKWQSGQNTSYVLKAFVSFSLSFSPRVKSTSLEHDDEYDDAASKLTHYTSHTSYV